MRLNVKLETLAIKQSLDIYEIMQMVLKRENKVNQCKEHFWVIALNSANKILNLELVSTGCTTKVVIKPMEILSIPLQKRAVGIIMVHNHPSGRIEPSEQDKDLTDRMIQACRLMQTPVLDHVIITTHSYFSFKDSKLLEQLEESKKYVLPYDLEKEFYDDMQAEIKKVQEESEKKIQESLKRGMEIGEEKGEKKGRSEGKLSEKFEIAKNLLLKLKLDLHTVQAATGLSIDELERLKHQ